MAGINPLVASMLFGIGKKPGLTGTPPFVPPQQGAMQTPQGSGGGFLDKADQFLQKPGGNFLMNLLAQSGYSTMPQSPLAAVGRAGLMTQQQQQQSGMAELQKRMLESQIGLNEARSDAVMAGGGKGADSPFGAVDPSKFTQESIQQFTKSGNYGDLVLRESSRLSTADIANHQYLSSLSPEDRELFFRGKRDPRFQNLPGVGFGAPSQTTGEFQVSVPEQVILSGTQDRAQAGAQGSATGAARGDQAAKGPVLESYKVAAQSVRDAMKNSMQGGWMGISGKMGGLIDSQDAMKFDNSVQQLSTELRTVFRIPGEGTLSDREQEQYNLQLPSRNFKAENNEKILQDLESRINARLTTPIEGAQSTSSVDSIADKYLNGQ